MKDVEAHFEGKMYSDLKSEIADLVISKLEPIQNRHKELMGDKGELERLLKTGAMDGVVRIEPSVKSIKRWGWYSYPDDGALVKGHIFEVRKVITR